MWKSSLSSDNAPNVAESLDGSNTGEEPERGEDESGDLILLVSCAVFDISGSGAEDDMLVAKGSII